MSRRAQSAAGTTLRRIASQRLEQGCHEFLAETGDEQSSRQA